MAVKVYNTLTRQKELFKPQVAGKVSMYVCGPTVYNYIHIGNLRSVIAFDTIRRYFEYRGYQVNYVSNFTDVDDKMIREAKLEGTTVPKLAARYIQAFLADTTALNVEPATLHPRATHEIPAIIAFIQVLLDKGYAYLRDGDVYYRARKFAHYGQLSDQKLDELEAGASEHVDKTEQNQKEDAIDFALWKKQKAPDEIAWQAPWGVGRPGWHIECSVMATKYLGNTVDIHGGGQDLEFPHHENEIAQSEAKTGQKFVNYWLHNGFVTVGSEQTKMSKSLHNFVTVHELLQRVNPVALRFYMASVQYRHPINYAPDHLVEAERILTHFKNVIEGVQYRLDDGSEPRPSVSVKAAIETTKAAFIAAMDDDFNVQNALAAIYDLLPVINQEIAAAQVDKTALADFLTIFSDWLGIFGVDLTTLTTKAVDDDVINALIAKRTKAREQKNWQESDAIRDQLAEMGIKLLDTAQGTRWTRE